MKKTKASYPQDKRQDHYLCSFSYEPPFFWDFHSGDVPSSSDQEKLKRAKRRIPGGETSVEEEMNLEPTAIIPERLADAVNDDTGENIQTLQTTEQDTEAVEFHWEADAGHGKINDSDTDCWKFLFTS
nr:uncharacterized protein LOC110437812 isoform X2 [Danio rerio]|eukprot:XP_021330566.1 uncharacterized protein LOC110437812 isoform X2 [Danio rerio]